MGKLEVLQKLKKLAEQGVGGEKVNAEKLLHELMIKYDIDEDSLEEEVEKQRIFYYKNKWEEKLLSQVAWAMFPNKPIQEFINKRYKAHRDCSIIYLTDAEVIEFEYRYSVYKNDWEKELELFYLAFISKNRIIPEEVLNKESDEPYESKYSFEEQLKMSTYMSSINKSNIRKSIEYEEPELEKD